MRIKLALDLTRAPDRAAMRAYLDALEPAAMQVAPLTAQQRAFIREAQQAGPAIVAQDETECAVSPDPGRASPRQGATPFRPGVCPAPEISAEDEAVIARALRGSTLERLGTPLAEPFGADAASTPVDGQETAQGEEAEAPPSEPAPASDDIEDADPGPCPIEGPEPPAPPPPPDAAPDCADLDPERPWTDDLKRRAWAMREIDGMQPSDIARALNLRALRVRSFFANVKYGSVKLPGPPPAGPSTALVPARPSTAVACADQRRPPAQDPELVGKWREDLARREREKAVTRSLYPN